MADDELARHLTTIRSQIENVTIDLARREELALEMAATLDRAAQSPTDATTRRRRWSEAIELLDWFLKENPDPPRERQVRFQAAVLRWAKARSWTETAAAGPARSTNRAMRPSPRFDNAIERFRSVAGGGNNPTLADNLRFRLAEALADRADLEPARPPAAGPASPRPSTCSTSRRRKAGLAGFWHLLKADLLRRLGKPTEAEQEIAAAVKSTPAPPAREVVEVKVPLLIEQKRYDDAIKSLGSLAARQAGQGTLDGANSPGSTGEACPPVPSGSRSSPSLFGWIKELRAEQIARAASRHCWIWPQARLVPDANQPPEVWESLADAYGTAGEPAKAGAAMVRAADRAAALGQPAAAAAYRLRGGGFLFQAGDYLEADKVLSRAVADPAAGALRAKAGMLRCLARGRALALGLPGASSGRLRRGPPSSSSAISQRPVDQ